MASLIKLACVVLMCMAVVGAPLAQAAISCEQVSSSLVPCLHYLQKGGPVPATCCDGVRSIVSAARTTLDRRAACNCLKSDATRVPGINPSNAESLPGKCKVTIPYKISTSTNCTSIK